MSGAELTALFESIMDEAKNIVAAVRRRGCIHRGAM